MVIVRGDTHDANPLPHSALAWTSSVAAGLIKQVPREDCGVFRIFASVDGVDPVGVSIRVALLTAYAPATG